MSSKNKIRKQVHNKCFADLNYELSLQQDPSNSNLRESIENLQHQINTSSTYKIKIAKQNF